MNTFNSLVILSTRYGISLQGPEMGLPPNSKQGRSEPATRSYAALPRDLPSETPDSGNDPKRTGVWNQDGFLQRGHNTTRKELKAAIDLGDEDCRNLLVTGGCKSGKNCKFHHRTAANKQIEGIITKLKRFKDDPLGLKRRPEDSRPATFATIKKCNPLPAWRERRMTREKHSTFLSSSRRDTESPKGTGMGLPSNSKQGRSEHTAGIER